MSHETRQLPAPPRACGDNDGFLRKLYDIHFPLDCRHFCKLVFAALHSSTSFKLNLSPHLEATSRGSTVTITEALAAFSTACGIPHGQNRTKRCMSFKEFERGLSLVSRNVFRNCRNSLLRFHDSILLPFAHQNQVVALLSFHPVVATWCRRTDVTAMFRKWFMTCTTLHSGKAVSLVRFEKLLLELGLFPRISKRNVKTNFNSVLIECTFHPHRDDGASGLSYLSFVECFCRCVSFGNEPHKQKRITIRNINAISDAIEHAGAICVVRHGISIHFASGKEVTKVTKDQKLASVIDFTDGKPILNGFQQLEESKDSGDENSAPSFEELLRKMPPRPSSTKSVKRQVLATRHRYNDSLDDWEMTPQTTPTSQGTPRRSSFGSPSLKSPKRSSPRRFGSPKGGMVSKEEYDIVVAKLRALEEALDMDLEKLDWDGSLDDAELKLKELIPGIMSEDPEEQAEAQRNFEVFDKIIRNHADYKQREAEKFEKWKEVNDIKNQEARELLRQRFPASIANGGVTKAELIEKHGITHAVARRLFSTKILRFVHMEPEQIAKIHVADLTGAYAPQGLDITETRAVYASLPNEFAVDGDGRKAAWRKSIQDNLIALVNLEEKGELKPNQIEHSAYRAKPGPPPSASKTSSNGPANLMDEMKKRGRSRSVCEASPDAPNAEALQNDEPGVRKSFLEELSAKTVNARPPERARSQSLGGPDCAQSPARMKHSRPNLMEGLQQALKLRKKQVDGDDASDDEDVETKKEPATPIKRLTFLTPPAKGPSATSDKRDGQPRSSESKPPVARKLSLIDELSSVLARRRESKVE